ncbi:UNVERIFIED_CONTAM: protein ARABIDILLO 1 [Sesamum angustifolium]|uniref:Protein ARABIDILLO 1 n=1 Tax=Sesamum angustifolium TaxID=2727405 RepID=A0AAW2RJW6_9LAMI
MMSRRVRRKVVRRGKEKLDCPETDEKLSLDENGMLDWTRLPDDTVLDLRPHKCDATAAAALASRCENLQKLRFRGPESAEAVIKLQAKNLREISGDCCRKMTDATLSVLAARHEALESVILRISGLHEVDADAINALAKNCRNLTDIGFIDCRKVDETALGNVASLRFLSVAGTKNIKWNLVLQEWSKLPHLIALDVSRTDIDPTTFEGLMRLELSITRGGCQLASNRNRGVLLAVFTDILKGVATLFVDTPKNNMNVFLDWRYSKVEDRRVNEILNWLEWIISNTLLCVSESNPPGLDNFWLNQGTTLLLSFMQSPRRTFKKDQLLHLQLLL